MQNKHNVYINFVEIHVTEIHIVKHSTNRTYTFSQINLIEQSFQSKAKGLLYNASKLLYLHFIYTTIL